MTFVVTSFFSRKKGFLLKRIACLPKVEGNICVPLIGKTTDEIRDELKNIITKKPDLIEWRIDYFEEFRNIEKVRQTFEVIRLVVGDCPLLVTLRTKTEGGQAVVTTEEYEDLMVDYYQQLPVDLLDVEWLRIQNSLSFPLIEAHSSVQLVISYHQFTCCLPKKEITVLLNQMSQRFPQAIYKCAQMPQSFQEVLDIMSIAVELGEKTPLVMIGMGELGKITRVLTNPLNNLLTFASVNQLSAPGQIEIEVLRLLMAQLNPKKHS